MYHNQKKHFSHYQIQILDILYMLFLFLYGAFYRCVWNGIPIFFLLSLLCKLKIGRFTTDYVH